jgi:hypothetical protein
MSSSKKIDLERDLSAGVYLSEAQNPIPPPYTLYTCIQFTYSHRKRGECWTREKVSGITIYKAVSKKTIIGDCISSL